MCGIVGYIGHSQAVPVLLYGLNKLEYRGYDSAGVAVYNKEGIEIVKSKGRLTFLEDRLSKNPLEGYLGIGHTRWATHGAPSDLNSHPQTSSSNHIAVVHNGIIENYMPLKEELESEGYTFVSETDTETAAHLIDYYYQKDKDLLDAVYKATSRIEGSYALGVLCTDYEDQLIGVRKDSPLIIGLGENENFLASDMPAILNYTRDVYLLDELEVAVIKKDSVQIYDQDKNRVNKEVYRIDWDIDAAEKGGYDYFMLKEINEQAKVVRDTLAPRLKEDGVLLDEITVSQNLQDIDMIYMVACGTASYVAQIGKNLIEKYAGIPVIADVASEFRYRNPILSAKTLVIVISQSGETADTVAALRLAKEGGARVLAVVNVIGATMAREADDVLYTFAGPEIAVASTKAFSAQVGAMYLLAMDFALALKKMTLEDYLKLKEALESLPGHMDHVLKRGPKIAEMAKKYLHVKNVFYIGRGLDYLFALEGSLKLKEIAYLHSEAFAAGELKHGPIALVEESTLIVGLITQEKVLQKTISNMKECKARGGKILAIAMEGNDLMEKIADDVFYIPRIHEDLAPLLANIVQQLFAYYMAVGLGNDVDRPRNLAKSVTVE